MYDCALWDQVLQRMYCLVHFEIFSINYWKQMILVKVY